MKWYCSDCDFPYTDQKSLIVRGLGEMSQCEKCGLEFEYPYLHYEPCPKCNQMTLLISKDGCQCPTCGYKSFEGDGETVVNHPSMGLVRVNGIGEVIDYAEQVVILYEGMTLPDYQRLILDLYGDKYFPDKGEY